MTDTTDAPTKKIIDQVACDLPHAYQYREVLIVLENTADVDITPDHQDPTFHITFTNGETHSVGYHRTVDISQPMRLLQIATDVVDERIEAGLDAEEPTTFADKHLRVQHDYLYADLSLEGEEGTELPNQD